MSKTTSHLLLLSFTEKCVCLIQNICFLSSSYNEHFRTNRLFTKWSWIVWRQCKKTTTFTKRWKSLLTICEMISTVKICNVYKVIKSTKFIDRSKIVWEPLRLQSVRDNIWKHVYVGTNKVENHKIVWIWTYKKSMSLQCIQYHLNTVCDQTIKDTCCSYATRKQLFRNTSLIKCNKSFENHMHEGKIHHI